MLSALITPQGFSLPPGQVVLIFLKYYIRSVGLDGVPYGHKVTCGAGVMARSWGYMETYKGHA